MGRIKNFSVPTPHFFIFCIKICHFPFVSGRISDFSPTTPRFRRMAGRDTDIFSHTPRKPLLEAYYYTIQEKMGRTRLFFAHTPHSNMNTHEIRMFHQFRFLHYLLSYKPIHLPHPDHTPKCLPAGNPAHHRLLLMSRTG